MNLTFTPLAWEDYQWFAQHDRKLLKRINQLIQDALRTPFEGIGKPEPLKGRPFRILVSTHQRRASSGSCREG
jgi:Txe/YoeB family toxin of toxin-antitoxin system